MLTMQTEKEKVTFNLRSTFEEYLGDMSGIYLEEEEMDFMVNMCWDYLVKTGKVKP